MTKRMTYYVTKPVLNPTKTLFFYPTPDQSYFPPKSKELLLFLIFLYPRSFSRHQETSLYL